MDDILTEVLSHLGLKVMKQDDAFVLVGKNNNSAVDCYTIIGWTTSRYHDCKELANALLNYIKLFYIYGTDTIAFLNPCYGCKSLEEAIIKIDLNPAVENLLDDKTYNVMTKCITFHII